MPVDLDIERIRDLVLQVGLYVAVFFAVVLFLFLLRKFIGFVLSIRTKRVFLEITPPAFQDKSPDATQSLFDALHGLNASRSFLAKLLGVQVVLSPEIVSSRKDGIRFVIGVAEAYASTLEHSLAAYLPDAKVKRLETHPVAAANNGRIFGFKQARHFAYPLQKHDALSANDPSGYITSAMTKLANDEIMVFQLVLRPVVSREANSLRYKILTNENVVFNLGGNKSVPWLKWLVLIINKINFGIIDLIGNIYDHNTSRYPVQSAQRDLEHQKQVAQRIKPARMLSVFEEELVGSIQDKLSQPLFKASIRAYVGTTNKAEIKKRKGSLSSALSLFTVPKYQSLKLVRRKFGLGRKLLEFAFSRRLVGLSSRSSLLSSSELAGLYHFPHSTSARTENVVKSLSKTLPAPISLKNGTELDVLFGKNVYQGVETPIGLTAAERERHMYVVGGTGNGKM